MNSLFSLNYMVFLLVHTHMLVETGIFVFMCRRSLCVLCVYLCACVGEEGKETTHGQEHINNHACVIFYTVWDA